MLHFLMECIGLTLRKIREHLKEDPISTRDREATRRPRTPSSTNAMSSIIGRSSDFSSFIIVTSVEGSLGK